MFSRYNPDNLSTLERYVEIQSQENAYDLEANLAVLKLYQFNQKYNEDITCQILLKALTNFPHTDFILCKCLLNQNLVIIFSLYQVNFSFMDPVFKNVLIIFSVKIVQSKIS